MNSNVNYQELIEKAKAMEACDSGITLARKYKSLDDFIKNADFTALFVVCWLRDEMSEIYEKFKAQRPELCIYESAGDFTRG